MRQRIDYIVFLRVFCTICVLIDHVPLVASHVFASQITSTDFFATKAIVHLVHFAVPVFVMITGALLLDPSRPVPFEKALKKYAWRMVVVLLTVGWFFAMMEYYSTYKEISFSLFFIPFLNVLTGNTWTHMWYLYMLVGLYLIIPFLKTIVENSQKNVIALIVILFIFTSAMPAVNVFFGFKLGVEFPISSCYVLYLLLGYVLSKSEFKMKCVPVIVIVILSVFLLFCCYGEKFGGEWTEKLNFFDTYRSPIEVLIASALFLFAKNISYRSMCDLWIIKVLDNNSFGIYVFHMLWINILYKVLKINPFDYGLFMLIPVLIGVLVLSVLTTEIFRRLPLVGKFI